MSFNKVTLIGNLGRDPELRYTPQGTAVCNFSIATNEKRRDRSGEFQDITTWFRVTLWGQQAENAAKYLAKGRQVYIEGRLKLEEWKDKDGNNRFTLDVTASEMQFLSGARDEEYHGESTGGGMPDYAGPANSGSSSGGSSASASDFAPPASADDDIPF